jgi:hypothetical protein
MRDSAVGITIGFPVAFAIVMGVEYLIDQLGSEADDDDNSSVASGAIVLQGIKTKTLNT